MDVHLSLVDEGGGKVIAHAAVVDDDGRPVTKVSVSFKKNGKDTGRQIRVDDDGVATKELSLKVGEEFQITASVVGRSHVADRATIIPEGKKRRPTSMMEWVISGLFLIVVLKYGYTTMTVVGIIATMIVLFVKSLGDHEDTMKAFGKRIADNNWVYYTILSLTIICTVFFLIGLTGGPLPEMNPVKYAWEQLKDAVSSAPVNPYANDGWGVWLTQLFLGENGGWAGATLSFFVWTLIAYPVSFWDDWVAKRKESKGEKKGGLLTRFIDEGIGELLWWPLKKILGGKK